MATDVETDAFERALLDRLVRGGTKRELLTQLVALVGARTPLPWAALALPPPFGPVVGAALPAEVRSALGEVAESMRLAAPARAIYVEDAVRPPAEAPPAPPGVGAYALIPLARHADALAGVLWAGSPTPVAISATARTRLERAARIAAVITDRTFPRRALVWARRLPRAGGVLARLAADAPLAEVLDALCRSLEELMPAAWSVVTWPDGAPPLLVAPHLAPAARAHLERAVADAASLGPPRSPRSDLYARHRLLRRAASGLGPDAGARPLVQPVRAAADAEVVASLLLFRPSHAHWPLDQRALVRAASHLAAIAIALDRAVARRLRQARRDELLLATGAHLAWRLDHAGAMVESHGWRELTGTALPAAFDTWLDAVHPADRDGWRRLLASLDRPSEAAPAIAPSIECRVLAADGHYRRLACRLLPERDERGRTLATFVAGVDVTARRQAEDVLQAVVHAREHFVSVFAHEMRTPLASMVAALEVLRPAVTDDGAASRALAVLTEAVARQSRLVADVLDRTRLGAEHQAVAGRRLDLVALLSELGTGFALQARQKGLDFALDLPDGALWLDGDRERLGQVFANLVANAVRYTPRGGAIVVRLRPCPADALGPAGAQVEVRDSGPGIDAADLPHVFDLYYRGAAAHRQEGADDASATGGPDAGLGMGIGLSLVRELVRAHGGSVSAASAGPGLGATFTVRLPFHGPLPVQTLLATFTPPTLPQADASPPPAIDAAVPSPAPSALSPQPQPRATGVVLVVEDDRGLREMLVALLARAGYTARTARTAAEALGRASAGPPPTAIVCDLGLPDLSGLELLPRLRALPGYAAVPALALTGLGEAIDRERSRLSGFERHVVKPADIAEILAWLAQVSGRGATKAAAPWAVEPSLAARR